MSPSIGMVEIALLGSSCLCFMLVIVGVIAGVIFMKKKNEQG